MNDINSTEELKQIATKQLYYTQVDHQTTGSCEDEHLRIMKLRGKEKKIGKGAEGSKNSNQCVHIKMRPGIGSIIICYIHLIFIFDGTM